ncbi:MAG: hypothetical protein HY848_01410 [Betaproteobacteria bacterium]|nr:hypothetical protein [Betaproteobacteria bacterium]
MIGKISQDACLGGRRERFQLTLLGAGRFYLAPRFFDVARFGTTGGGGGSTTLIASAEHVADDQQAMDIP